MRNIKFNGGGQERGGRPDMNLQAIQNCRCGRGVGVRPKVLGCRKLRIGRERYRESVVVRGDSSEFEIMKEDDLELGGAPGELVIREEQTKEEATVEEIAMEKMEKMRKDRYRVFSFEEEKMVGMISEKRNGHLDLRETYLHEEESGVLAKPDMRGIIPEGHRCYKVIEWDDWVSGDCFEEIEEKMMLKRVYFVNLHDGDPRRPDFYNMYCFNPARRILFRCKVIDNSKGSDDIIMRILPTGVFLEDTFDAGDPLDVANRYNDEELMREEEELIRDPREPRTFVDVPEGYSGDYKELIMASAKLQEGGDDDDGIDYEAQIDTTGEQYDGGLDELPDVPEVDSS